jgi:hypothetical protein
MPDHETAAPWLLPYPDPTGKAKLGAVDFKELAERLTAIFKEKILIFKSYTGSATLKSGEFAEQAKAGETFTLPAATTANQMIGVYNVVAGTPIKVTTSGGALIFGDFLTGVATIQLTVYQHVIFQSVGGNWLIIAGEPKNEAAYASKGYSKAQVEAGVEPSASRRALVTILGVIASGEVVVTGGESTASKFTTTSSATVLVPAGQKWKSTVEVTTGTILL